MAGIRARDLEKRRGMPKAAVDIERSSTIGSTRWTARAPWAFPPARASQSSIFCLMTQAASVHSWHIGP